MKSTTAAILATVLSVATYATAQSCAANINYYQGVNCQGTEQTGCPVKYCNVYVQDSDPVQYLSFLVTGSTGDCAGTEELEIVSQHGVIQGTIAQLLAAGCQTLDDKYIVEAALYNSDCSCGLVGGGLVEFGCAPKGKECEPNLCQNGSGQCGYTFNT